MTKNGKGVLLNVRAGNELLEAGRNRSKEAQEYAEALERFEGVAPLGKLLEHPRAFE